MRNVMPMKPSDLTDVAPHYYKKKDLETLGLEKKMPKGKGAVGGGGGGGSGVKL